ncbi:MAG TPA: endonuclease [Candidatus Wallbacteria bacterium]|nr:endonuclease [Candidatus Wallbacteria bacterium]
MKKFFYIVIVLSLLLSFSSAWAGEIEADVEETGSFPAPDPAYGVQHQHELIGHAIEQMNVVTKSGVISNINALAIDKKLNELDVIISKKDNATRSDLTLNENRETISKLSEEIKNVLSVTRNSASEPALEVIKADVDKAAATAGNFDSCNGLSNEELKGKLNQLVKDQRCLGYNEGRKTLFTKIDNFGGKVKCVYTAREVACNGIPNANAPEAMNTEHTWPKSLGAANEPAKSDLNHLYAADTFANSTRSSNPFGNVNEATAKWKQGGSAFDGKNFMPREDHRGKVARAYFYFSVRYQLGIPESQEAVLKEWHKKYPVTQAERDRNEKVFSFQGNRNPFVDRPDFAEKISNF